MLKNKNFSLAFYLFILGISGILSLLLVPFNAEVLPDEAKKIILSKFTEFQLRILSLINPTILLLFSLLIGFWVNKDKYQFSYFYSYISKVGLKSGFFYFLGTGIIYGLVFSVIVRTLYIPFDNTEEILLLEKKSPAIPLITKLLYGGITEEIITRWGWLSLLFYITNKLFKKKKISYILAIALSSLIFAIGHLPIVYQNLGTSSVSTFIVLYIVSFNTFLGIVFGYLFVKFNIETAIFAHISFHLFLFLINILI